MSRGCGTPAWQTSSQLPQRVQSSSNRAVLVAGRSPAYWDVVAGSFVGRGRSFSQLSAYAEAAITSYRIVAVLDEVTTPTCRFLDGKTFSVSRGLELFDRVEANPDSIDWFVAFAARRA